MPDSRRRQPYPTRLQIHGDHFDGDPLPDHRALGRTPTPGKVQRLHHHAERACLAVVGREIRDALGHAWRVAGRISLAVGRFPANIFRWIFVESARWVYRTVLTPAGHFVRDAVWKQVAAAGRLVGRTTRQVVATARESGRQARARVRSALLGRPAEPKPVHRREPGAAETRTLGRSTTALTKD